MGTLLEDTQRRGSARRSALLLRGLQLTHDARQEQRKEVDDREDCEARFRDHLPHDWRKPSPGCCERHYQLWPPRGLNPYRKSWNCQASSFDVSPLRRVNQAIWLLCTGAREAAFRNIKSIAECLSDELINAAKGSSNSYAIKKKDELERVAKSNR